MWLLSIIAIASSQFCQQKLNYTLTNSTYPFTLSRLPYPTNFLEPVLSNRIVTTHYSAHHQAYITKLNVFIANNLKYFNSTYLSDLTKNGFGQPNLEKYAGGAYNHYLYFWTLTSPLCAVSMPTGALGARLNSTFGTFQAFVGNFSSVASSVFGNGWTWLSVCGSTLNITTTPYQYSPLMQSCYPVLGIDLWEHAFYLEYFSDKAAYINNFWKIVDWKVVQFFYDNFASQMKAVPF